MLDSGLRKIKTVLGYLKGINGEPKNDAEKYLLMSMWVMLMSEFESCIKDQVELHIDKVKKNKKVRDMHICFLLNNKFGNKPDEILSINKILQLFKTKKKEITYKNFTQNKVPKYKFDALSKLFNSLGIFFNENQDLIIKQIDGIASTRDSIAHGDRGIAITRKQLEADMLTIKRIYNCLKSSLKI